MSQMYNRNQYDGRRGQSAQRTDYVPKREHQILTEENYVDLAEQAIDHLIGRSKTDFRGNPKVVTTSKIRNLLAMTADLYNDIVNLGEEELPMEILGRINYLRVRVIYEAGREAMVNDLVDSAQILEHIRDIKKSRRQYILFSRYMESLVAFRKYKVRNDD